MKIFDKELIKRQDIANYYSKELKEFLKVPYIEKNNKSSWAQYSLLAKSKVERDDLVSHLNKNKIPTAIFYKKIFSELEIYKDYNLSTCNVSKMVSEKIFSIPMHPYLKNEETNMIVSTIKSFFTK